MKNTYLLFFLLIGLFSESEAQTWLLSPEPVIRDTFNTTIYVDYGDSAALSIWDRWGREIKTLIPLKIHTCNIVKVDTILHLKVSGYYPIFWQPDGKINIIKTIYYVGVDSVIHFKANLIINPESIPAETFVIYPNPATEGNVSLLYAQDWANGVLTISNGIGQILYTTC